MTRKTLLIFLAWLISTSAISATTIPTLRIHGSNTVGTSLVPSLLQSWLRQNGYTIIYNAEIAAEEHLIKAKNQDDDVLNIELHAHGSSTSFKDLAAGKADLGMSSRPIKAKEVSTLSRLGDMSKPKSEYVIALDGLSVIVHADNPLVSIKKDRLKQIFSGEITHWSQLDIKGGKINVYARDNKSGTYDTFKSLVLGKQVALVNSARRYESNAKLSDDVARDINGIGFTGLAYVRNARALAIAATDDALPLKPMPFNVATEDYALARRLFLYLPQKGQHPLAKEFADFAISNHAQAIVKQVGFVSQTIFEQNIALPKQAPAEYKKLTQGARRLSLNVRFRTGKIALDNKAVNDIQRLAAFVKKPENRQRQLMLFGFADRFESLPYASLSLSIERADRVASEFVKNHIIPVRTRGYGAELPVATNETEKGHYKNRRVEVWIK